MSAKPTQSSKRARKPKARVYFCDSPSGIYLELTGYRQTDRHYPVVVIPTPSAARGKKLAQFVNKGERRMIQEVAAVLANDPEYMDCIHARADFENKARACLTAAGLLGRGE